MKTRITAPPTDGKANNPLIDFLAQHFRVSKRVVAIARSHLARQKTLQIHQPRQLLLEALVAKKKLDETNLCPNKYPKTR